MNRLSLFIRRPFVLACLALAALILLVYGDVLFAANENVLSDKNTDLAVGIYGLKFVFGELGRGNFPLWNPHLLSGYPLFASFQTMLLYPPAWIWAVLPLAKATNLFIIFHLWLMGAGMIWWMLRRGLHPVAAFVAGVLLCLGSTGTMRVFPGHITPLAVVAWMPIMLAILDGFLIVPSPDEGLPARKGSTLLPVLAGGFVVAMQIAAGFPQHFFYTALAVAIYYCVRLFQLARDIAKAQRARFIFSRLACAAVIYSWGILLLAVQLLTSWHASKETARAASLPFEFVGSFSLPPENFLTLLAPGFFGGNKALTYWGSGYAWEMTFFIGVAGILLALYALIVSQRKERFAWIAAAAFMLVLALGRHTFLLRFLYDHVPIFGGFRASARALCQASVFVCALAGLGLDLLIRNEKIASSRRTGVAKFWPAVAAIIGFTLMAMGVWLQTSGALPTWQKLFAGISGGVDSYMPPAIYSDPKAIAAIMENGGATLLLAGTACLVLAILMRFLARSHGPRAQNFAFAIAAFCVLEVAYFAASIRPTFDLRALENPAVEQVFASPNGDDRFLKSTFDNYAMKWSANDLAGYESFRLRRYEEFINWTQDRNPNAIEPVLEIARPHPLYAMLRCRFFLDVETMQKTPIANVLPRVLLVNDYQVLPSRDAMFAAMKSPQFNPRKTVLLESEPLPRPLKNAPVGTARIVESSTDHLVIEAQTQTPSILLITDSYSRDWRAWSVGDENSAQREYSVLPANWVLRAIPIEAGKHKIRLEYLPRIFVIGKWISLISLLGFVAALGFALKMHIKTSLTHAAIS